jgi:single-strand DNA-binding protein
MAGSVSKTILVGRLGKDPETRTFQNGGKVVSFSLATSENWRDNASGERKERTEWHNIAIFNEALAEVAERYLRKGALVYLEGQNETRSWEKDGQRHSTTVPSETFVCCLNLITQPVKSQVRCASRAAPGATYAHPVSHKSIPNPA